MKPYSVDPIVPAFLSTTHLDHQPSKKFEGIGIKNATTINESSKLDKRKMSTACVQAKRGEIKGKKHECTKRENFNN
jgi:hypothetical protein